MNANQMCFVIWVIGVVFAVRPSIRIIKWQMIEDGVSRYTTLFLLCLCSWGTVIMGKDYK